MYIDAMPRAAKGEFDAMVDQAFAVRTLAGAHLIEQRHRSFFQQTGTDAAEHIIRRLAFQDDVIDPVGVKQLPQQHSRRPGTDDGYFSPQYALPRVHLGCKAKLEGNACGRLAMIIISYNKFRNGRGANRTLHSAALQEHSAIFHGRYGGGPEADVRLEKSDKLDNMLINEIGH